VSVESQLLGSIAAKIEKQNQVIKMSQLWHKQFIAQQGDFY